jgi:hypothetical protein
MAPLTVLHLTDLHFGCDASEVDAAARNLCLDSLVKAGFSTRTVERAARSLAVQLRRALEGGRTVYLWELGGATSIPVQDPANVAGESEVQGHCSKLLT